MSGLDLSTAGAQAVAEVRRPGRLRRIVGALWRYLFGALLAMNPVSAIAVVGWTNRWVQRAVVRRLCKLSPTAQTFESFVQDNDDARSLLRSPNWITRQDFRRELAALESASKLRRAWFSLTSAWHSLYRNFRIGLLALFNTWVLTIPACFFWLYGWFAGWNNSFHKGYEHAWVGPVTGMLGVALFIAVMFYVPLAQARQAVTGDWKSFWDGRFLRTLQAQSWKRSILVAAGYSLISLPFSILLTLPGFFPQISPELAEFSDAEVLSFLRRYYFGVALYGFAAFVALRWISGRAYTSALLSAWKRGRIERSELAPVEARVLDSLGLLPPVEDPKRGILPAVRATSHRAVRWACGALAVFAWFSFVAQIFVREFLNYHPVIGWLNQALVQLPWFSHIPSHLSDGV
ncbi:MAG: hypothetical protein AAF517_14070 [Planctomycetota bacterium]